MPLMSKLARAAVKKVEKGYKKRWYDTASWFGDPRDLEFGPRWASRISLPALAAYTIGMEGLQLHQDWPKIQKWIRERKKKK